MDPDGNSIITLKNLSTTGSNFITSARNTNVPFINSLISGRNSTATKRSNASSNRDCVPSDRNCITYRSKYLTSSENIATPLINNTKKSLNTPQIEQKSVFYSDQDSTANPLNSSLINYNDKQSNGGFLCFLT